MSEMFNFFNFFVGVSTNAQEQYCEGDSPLLKLENHEREVDLFNPNPTGHSLI